MSTFRIPAPLLAAKLVRISRSRERQDKGGGMWTAWSGQSLGPWPPLLLRVKKNPFV